MDPTSVESAPYLLDLTRLISRAGRSLTGVDRVEFAYLRHLVETGPAHALVRTRLGHVLLGPDGCACVLDKLTHGGWGPPDLLSRVTRPGDPMRQAAEADLRRLCLARTLPAGLHHMLRRHFPAGLRYLNVGHSNLTDRVIAAVRALPFSRIAVMIHDTIPLDAPDYQRPETLPRFRALLQRAGRAADLIICNSYQTRSDIQRHLPDAPQTVVAHLGVDVPRPGRTPDGPWRGHPCFVTLGTIEPRKNHALLLDLWPSIPEAHLLICGHRGWQNDAVFARLDARPDRVHEMPGLPDPEVFALLQESAGLLFPSLAEGYGLPPIEAAALGVPVICNDLPIYREVLGDIPVYANVSDRYLWQTRIIEQIEDLRRRGGAPAAGPVFQPPGWEAHFNSVLRMIR